MGSFTISASSHPVLVSLVTSNQPTPSTEYKMPSPSDARAIDSLAILCHIAAQLVQLDFTPQVECRYCQPLAELMRYVSGLPS
jgi:hypothetical protein